MTNQPIEGDSKSSKLTKTPLTVSLCSILTVLSNQIPDPVTKQIFLVLSSPFGFFLAFLIKLGLQEINKYRACKAIKQIISELKDKLKEPDLGKSEIKIVQKEITTYEKMLHKERLNNIKIDTNIS